jgi:hypothetical protein
LLGTLGGLDVHAERADLLEPVPNAAVAAIAAVRLELAVRVLGARSAVVTIAVVRVAALVAAPDGCLGGGIRIVKQPVATVEAVGIVIAIRVLGADPPVVAHAVARVPAGVTATLRDVVARAAVGAIVPLGAVGELCSTAAIVAIAIGRILASIAAHGSMRERRTVPTIRAVEATIAVVVLGAFAAVVTVVVICVVARIGADVVARGTAIRAIRSQVAECVLGTVTAVVAVVVARIATRVGACGGTVIAKAVAGAISTIRSVVAG